MKTLEVQWAGRVAALALIGAVFAAPARAADFQVVGSIPAPGGALVQGLAWDGSSLWATERANVHELNPADGTVRSFFVWPSGDTQGPQGAAYDGDGNLRIASWSLHNVYRLSRAGDVLSFFDAPPPYNPRGVTWDGGGLWLSANGTGGGTSPVAELHHLTPDGALIETLEVDLGGAYPARDLAFDGSNLWLAVQNGGAGAKNLLRIGTSGAVLDAYSLSEQGLSGSPYGLTWDGQALWVAMSDGVIYRLQPLTPPTPRVALVLNGETFTTGDEVVAEARVTNDATSDVVDARVWITYPDGRQAALLSMNQMLVPAGHDATFEVLRHSFNEGEAGGEYCLKARFLDWISGDGIAGDTACITFSP